MRHFQYSFSLLSICFFLVFVGTPLVIDLTALLPHNPESPTPVYFSIRGSTPQENYLRNFRKTSNPGDTSMSLAVEVPPNYEVVKELWLHLRASVSVICVVIS